MTVRRGTRDSLFSEVRRLFDVFDFCRDSTIRDVSNSGTRRKSEESPQMGQGGFRGGKVELVLPEFLREGPRFRLGQGEGR